MPAWLAMSLGRRPGKPGRITTSEPRTSPRPRASARVVASWASTSREVSSSPASTRCTADRAASSSPAMASSSSLAASEAPAALNPRAPPSPVPSSAQHPLHDTRAGAMRWKRRQPAGTAGAVGSAADLRSHRVSARTTESPPRNNSRLRPPVPQRRASRALPADKGRRPFAWRESSHPVTFALLWPPAWSLAAERRRKGPRRCFSGCGRLSRP